MHDLFGKPPWYAAGLAFECVQCGRCCQGPEEGYVWVTDEEIARIAKVLGLSETQMRRQYVVRVGHRQSLKEAQPSKDCIFLESSDRAGPRCRIYSVRPVQCRTWPFWDGNVATPGDWARAGIRCKGINRGKLFPFEEIESRRKRTQE